MSSLLRRLNQDFVNHRGEKHRPVSCCNQRPCVWQRTQYSDQQRSSSACRCSKEATAASGPPHRLWGTMSDMGKPSLDRHVWLTQQPEDQIQCRKLSTHGTFPNIVLCDVACLSLKAKHRWRSCCGGEMVSGERLNLLSAAYEALW